MVQEHQKQTETQIVIYLDVTLKCNNSSFKFYHQPDDIIQYINKESNDSPSIMKNGFQTILLINFFFKEAAIYYENTLNKASYISLPHSKRK